MTDVPPQSPPSPDPVPVGMDLEAVALVARAVAEKTLREMVQSRTRPATVVEFSGNVARVHVDGDPPETTVEAESLVSPAPFPDARVMVRFEPPNAVFVDHWITRPDPPGKMDWFASATPPAGYLLADGRAVGRVEYAALFEAVGTLYGTGDGSTTFNLPNALGRFWVGAGGTYAVGAIGGADSVTLTSAQMPIHNHGGGKHRHFIPSSSYYTFGAGTFGIHGVNPDSFSQGTTEDPAGNTLDQGGGGSHENRPPYIGFLPCISY